MKYNSPKRRVFIHSHVRHEHVSPHQHETPRVNWPSRLVRLLLNNSILYLAQRVSTFLWYTTTGNMSDRTQRRDDLKRRSRSRSPSRQEHHAHRTRSPIHNHYRHKRSSPRPEVPRELPCGARQLTKRDFAVFRPLFALYLDIQKQKVLDDLDEVEAKGRWKSFMGKW